ncbi:M67 family metallopeptidase [bacterium]|jgi:[CysO sulfur-carrier protein]-S-L-cysteine hydrolase|nr:M67 family metallopeptidase [bacterium]
MQEISIPGTIIDEMIAHSERLNPIESCGYLAGKETTVTKHYEMTNVDQAHDHFTFDPKEQFSVVKDARNEGLQLQVVYHSHPESPARLSEEDLRLLQDPNMVYIIVSLAAERPDLKAFRIQDGTVSSVAITRV